MERDGMRDVGRLVYERLSSDAEAASMLATYYGSPAIMNTEFPSDQEEGWEGKAQFPRISYRYDKQADYKRNTSGTLRVAIYAPTSQMDVSERIEGAVRRRLQDVLMQPDDGPPFCVSWSQTLPFEVERTGQLIVAKEVSFDIVEYPGQFVATPDPARTMSMGLKELFPQAFVVGIDGTGESGWREATEESPILYVSVGSFEVDRTSYALSWVACKMAVHVIAPTSFARGEWVRAVADVLIRAREAVMDDGSQLYFREVHASNKSDYLAAGQIALTGRYTLNRLAGTEEKLTARFTVRSKEA